MATTSRITATVSATALAFGIASGLAWADGSDGLGMDALIAAAPRDGTGWSNGPASLSPQGGGDYRLEYETPLTTGGAGMPGVAVVVGNSEGNPIIERMFAPPGPARALASRTLR